MTGSDYFERFEGIGINKALNLLNKYKSFLNIPVENFNLN